MLAIDGEPGDVIEVQEVDQNSRERGRAVLYRLIRICGAPGCREVFGDFVEEDLVEGECDGGDVVEDPCSEGREKRGFGEGGRLEGGEEMGGLRVEDFGAVDWVVDEVKKFVLGLAQA